jgi:hypothetical protein
VRPVSLSLEVRGVGDITIPREPQPTRSPLVRNLTIVASALTAASIAVNLVLQVAHFLQKRPMEPDQRDRLQAAGLALTVLKHMPPLIRQLRLLADQLRAAT